MAERPAIAQEDFEAASLERLEDIIRLGIKDGRAGKGEHHRACQSRGGRPCDCYARLAATSHEALDELISRVRHNYARNEDDSGYLMPEETDRGWAVQ